MRTRSATSRWILGVGSGLLFGVLFGLFGWIAGLMPWPEPVVAGIFTGTLFGGSMAITGRRNQRQLETAAGDLSPDRVKAAERAATRGPVPTDPQVREAAVRIAQSRIDSARRMRVLTMIAIVLLTASAVVNVLAGNVWTAVFSSLAVLAMVNSLYQGKRQRRRVAELSAPVP